MPTGIVLFGPPGSGTTTIGREVAGQLAYPHIDLDDHHWRWDTDIPYTVFRSQEERIDSLMTAIAPHRHFVMSGSLWSIRKPFEPLFDLAGYVSAPAELRAERVRTRELTRWGSRVLPGGDMYATGDYRKDYLAMARFYDLDESPEAYRKQHEQWLSELRCPVLRVDGAKPVADTAETIIRTWRDRHNERRRPVGDGATSDRPHDVPPRTQRSQSCIVTASGSLTGQPILFRPQWALCADCVDGIYRATFTLFG